MTALTIVGNLTGDPELRFTASGKAVANFTVAHTPRYRDSLTGEYRDGETLFLRCSIWNDYAQHVAASLHRGVRVVVAGRLRSRSYETKPTDGTEPQTRTVFELDADEVGPSLRFAECTVRKADRSTVGSGGDVPADPWAVPRPASESSAA